MSATEIILSLILGALSGVIATFIYVWLEDKKFQKRYGQIDGFYQGFDNNGRVISSATVTYIHKNVLEIDVNEEEHQNHIWMGFISLYNEKNGTLEWFYVKPDNLLGRFGLKKIIIRDKENFTLVGDSNEGYGVEIFKRLPIEKETKTNFIIRLCKYYFQVLRTKIKKIMKPTVKKVIAREFLIIISILIISGVVYSISYLLSNNYENKYHTLLMSQNDNQQKQNSIVKELANLENQIDDWEDLTTDGLPIFNKKNKVVPEEDLPDELKSKSNTEVLLPPPPPKKKFNKQEIVDDLGVPIRNKNTIVKDSLRQRDIHILKSRLDSINTLININNENTEKIKSNFFFRTSSSELSIMVLIILLVIAYQGCPK